MNFSLETLKKILEKSEFYGFSENEEFSLLNIAHLKEFEDIKIDNSILYFIVYEDNPELLGWYNQSFDRTANISKLVYQKNIVFLIDDRVNINLLFNSKYIKVDNIFTAVKKICSYVLSVVNPKVIGITGSVGKTTTASLTHDILCSKYQCKRIYSKRITPLTLSSWIVNFLEQRDEIITLEYSMYRKEHVGQLSDILKPYIGVFLNIKKMHFGVLGINSLQDIFEGKKDLITKSNFNILNLDDLFIRSLLNKQSLTFSLENPHADAYIEEKSNYVNLYLNNIGKVIKFNPYIKTNLFYQQVAAASLAATYLEIPENNIELALNNFIPAENRITWINFNQHQILFDADVTIGSRIQALAENKYRTSILLIHTFDFGEENVDLQIEDFNQSFSLFNQTRILDSKQNREVIKKYNIKNFIFCHRKDFLTNINDYEFKVLHFGTYFRKYKNLDFLKESILFTS